jgi:hypothetical protein
LPALKEFSEIIERHAAAEKHHPAHVMRNAAGISTVLVISVMKRNQPTK